MSDAQIKAQQKIDAYKRRNAEVRELIDSVPLARTVIVLHEPFMQKSRQLLKTVKRLKAWVRLFKALWKLNPLKYNEWWHNAYAASSLKDLAPLALNVPKTQLVPEKSYYPVEKDGPAPDYSAEVKPNLPSRLE